MQLRLQSRTVRAAKANNKYKYILSVCFAVIVLTGRACVGVCMKVNSNTRQCLCEWLRCAVLIVLILAAITRAGHRANMAERLDLQKITLVRMCMCNA